MHKSAPKIGSWVAFVEPEVGNGVVINEKMMVAVTGGGMRHIAGHKVSVRDLPEDFRVLDRADASIEHEIKLALTAVETLVSFQKLTKKV